MGILAELDQQLYRLGGQYLESLDQQLNSTALTVGTLNDTLVALPHLFETMGAWARRSGITDRTALTFLDAQLLISAQTTSEHASALFGAAATDLPRKGVAHPSGGIGGLSEQLVESIRANGGAVHFRQEVTRLEVKDNQVVAAHTNKGERFDCDLCIANLTPWNLGNPGSVSLYGL